MIYQKREEKCQHQMKCGDTEHSCMWLAFHGDFGKPHMCRRCTTQEDIANLMMAMSSR